MARDNQTIKSRALVRLCTENLFFVAELCESGSDFVAKMREDNAANRVSLGESELKEPGVADTGEGKTIRDLIKSLKNEFPKPSKLSVSDTAKGLMARAYPSYKLLSINSVHPSIDALRRHQDYNHQTMTVHLVPPFKPNERLDTLNKGCFVLLGVCVGVNQLLRGYISERGYSRALRTVPRVRLRTSRRHVASARERR